MGDLKNSSGDDRWYGPPPPSYNHIEVSMVEIIGVVIPFITGLALGYLWRSVK